MSYILYRALERLIESYARSRDIIQRGWYEKNESRVREWKLMAYAFSRSPIGVLGGFMVLITTILAV
ncbi:MAG: ABC transporter permease, partial [Sulfolobales archaeon]